jgi:hypothetical protein
MKRVIQIGFHCCGTRSLAQLSRTSGYPAANWRVAGPNGKTNLALVMKNNLEAGRKPLHRIDHYAFLSDRECFEDGKIWSGFLHFCEIDACLAMWSADWDWHLADVRSYFAARSDDLVTFTIDTDSVDDLIAQLPHFALDSSAGDHIGKSNPKHVARNRAGLTLLSLNGRI